MKAFAGILNDSSPIPCIDLFPICHLHHSPRANSLRYHQFAIYTRYLQFATYTTHHNCRIRLGRASHNGDHRFGARRREGRNGFARIWGRSLLLLHGLRDWSCRRGRCRWCRYSRGSESGGTYWSSSTIGETLQQQRGNLRSNQGSQT